MAKKEEPEDPRIPATAIIAGCGIGALAVTGGAGGVVIPIMIVLGSAAGVVSVWAFYNRGQAKAIDQGQVSQLEARIAELEDRIQAAETVELFEDRLAEKEAALRIKASNSPEKAMGESQ